jgi:hypothetical protein
VDNILPTTEANNRWYSQSMVNPLTVDAGEPVTFNGYRYWTANNGDARDPVSWMLEISDDGEAWFLADRQTNQVIPRTRQVVAGEWHLALPACDERLSCAIPDTSHTAVAAGATLALDGAEERIGPLSGAGTVALLNTAVLEINAFEDATFGGTFTGNGTLALAGDHTQTFTGGAAGDFALDFRGGRFGGTLNVGGALTVTGSVAYAQPAALPYSVTLFTFTSIDAPSREALIAGAASLDVPKGYVATVTVSGTTAKLSIMAPGTILILK